MTYKDVARCPRRPDGAKHVILFAPFQFGKGTRFSAAGHCVLRGIKFPSIFQFIREAGQYSAKVYSKANGIESQVQLACQTRVI